MEDFMSGIMGNKLYKIVGETGKENLTTYYVKII